MVFNDNGWFECRIMYDDLWGVIGRDGRLHWARAINGLVFYEQIKLCDSGPMQMVGSISDEPLTAGETPMVFKDRACMLVGSMVLLEEGGEVVIRGPLQLCKLFENVEVS